MESDLIRVVATSMFSGLSEVLAVGLETNMHKTGFTHGRKKMIHSFVSSAFVAKFTDKGKFLNRCGLLRPRADSKKSVTLD